MKLGRQKWVALESVARRKEYGQVLTDSIFSKPVALIVVTFNAPLSEESQKISFNAQQLLVES